MDKSFKAITYLAISIGIIYHLLLAARSNELLTDRPFRDDTFYALTISNNIADGKGLTTSDGSIPTNGFQPLFVFITAIPYFFFDDKFTPLRIIHIIQLLFHLLSGLIIYRLMNIFSDRKIVKLTAVSFWMSSYYLLKETSNGLETSLYLFMILLCCLFYLKYILSSKKPYLHFLFGLTLGLTTLTRIDAGFLFLALVLHFLYFNRKNHNLLGHLKYLSLWFCGWLIITGRWWLYNYDLTGSFIPTSGLVQTLHFARGSYFPFHEIFMNLDFSINTLLDQLTLIFVTPLRFIERIKYFSLIWNSARLILIIAVIYFFKKRIAADVSVTNQDDRFKCLHFYPLFIILLFLFYNFYFAVHWYLNRYLAPSIIIFIFLWSMVITKYRLIFSKIWILLCIIGSFIIGGTAMFKMYDYMYTEQIKWVKDHVDDSVWVAALQSGTLGYFHDKTINADGKVNSEIIKINSAYLGEYLLGKNVEYFIDEKQLEYVFKIPNLTEHYHLYDSTNNFWVLKRKSMTLDDISKRNLSR